jgi:hypothetical protein
MLPDRTLPGDYGLPFSDLDPMGVLDEETEQAASLYEAHAVDSSALTMVCPRAIAHVIVGTSPFFITSVADHTAVWGEAASVAPVVARNSAGNYTLTWDASGYPDLNPTPERQNTRAPAFRFAMACAAQSGYAPAVSWTSNTVTVAFTDDAGVAADTGFVVMVY